MKCYNACFALQKGDDFMLVDGGGGINILDQIDKAKIPIKSIKNIFVTHNHIDHIIGVIWVIRKICIMLIDNKYDGDVNIYASDVTIHAIRTLCNLVLTAKYFAYVDDRIHLNVVEDRQEVDILGDKFTFYDILASKEKQYGFRIDMINGKVLVCNGDERMSVSNYDIVRNADFLIHEAFCLESEKEIKQPYKKGHVTAKDVCEMVSQLNVKNLILYHIKSDDVFNRKYQYINENSKYFNGCLFVPNDLDEISI